MHSELVMTIVTITGPDERGPGSAHKKMCRMVE